MLFKDTLKNLMIPVFTMDKNGNFIETEPGAEEAYNSRLKSKEVAFTANERQQRKSGFNIVGKTENFYDFVEKTVKEHFPEAKLRKEGDILIFDEKHIGFQYCDLLKYSEKYFGYDKNYLSLIHQRYEEQGIRVIHIYQDEWKKNSDIVKSMINAAMGVFKERYYARKCRVDYLTKDEEIAFFNRNHLQGHSASKVCIGCFSGDTIICALSISTPRFSQKHDFEIIRFANKLNTQCIGGFMKCFEFFKKDHTGTIVTYSDARLFNSDSYRHNFTEISDDSNLELGYYYTNGEERFNRFKFQKFKLVKNNPEFEKITEHDISLLMSYYRVWDAGQRVFKYSWNNEGIKSKLNLFNSDFDKN